MKAPPPLRSALRSIVIGTCLLGVSLTSVHADTVTDWNTAVENNLLVPAERGPRVPIRTLAIMHAAMFDAVNGIERKYEPLFVTADAPPGARAEAAAIQAAYTTLSALRPGSQATWDAQLAASLASLPGDSGSSQSIARGREWGAAVATAIIAWRATDGSTAVLPPFVGSTDAGYWRHAPLGASPTAGYANLVTQPFLLSDPMGFDPGPPYGFADRASALTSPAYLADVNEIRLHGGVTSAVRTAAELEQALFIDACDVAGLNRLLRSVLHPQARLVDNARKFALFNMTAFDATVVFFRLKYHHALWRPFQAIRYAASAPDITWTSYLPTPPHPEYVSAHVTLFTALVHVAERFEGETGSVNLTAAASAFYPGGTKSFESLSAISDVSVEARINVGFHFRQTVQVSQILGRAIGDEIVDNYLAPRGTHGRQH
ncbi:MAG: vanadium-dependent haloperoxidase [Opitutus sp.]